MFSACSVTNPCEFGPLGHESAMLRHVIGEHFGDRTLVESRPSPLGHGPQRLAEIGLHQNVAGLQRLAVFPKPDLSCRLVLTELLHRALQAVTDPVRDGKSLLSRFDGRRPHFGHRHRAEFLDGQHGARHRARYARGERTIARNAAVRLVVLDRRLLRRDACAVDHLHALGLGVVQDRKEIAADAGCRRLDDRLHAPRGDRRVHSVAALLENAHAGFGRERMPGGDHPVLSVDGWPPRVREFTRGCHRRGPRGLRLLSLLRRLRARELESCDDNRGDQQNLFHDAPLQQTSGCRAQGSGYGEP
jgi:hypothetical protein